MHNGHDDRDNQRRLPPPLDEKLVDNQWRNGKTRQEAAPRPPLRALKIKGDRLRNAGRTGKTLDWSDLYERYVDLWQESRLCLWRAKHHKSGLKVIDPTTGKQVLTFVADEKLVLEVINCTKGILDSFVKLRKEMGEPSGIPRWAVSTIEAALKDHPAARNALLRELAAAQETK